MASFKPFRSSGPLPTLILLALLIGSVQPASAQCAEIPDCILVWSDEFDGTEVNVSKWTFQLGDGTEFGLPPGWGQQRASVLPGRERDGSRWFPDHHRKGGIGRRPRLHLGPDALAG